MCTLRNSGYLIPVSVSGRDGWDSEQPALVKSVPAYGRELGLGDL